MANFERTKTKFGINIERINADVSVVAGAGTFTHLGAVAQSKTDGKVYPYVKGDVNKGVIIGLYTGETETVSADEKILITTNVIIGKTDVAGVDFSTDFTAYTQLKQCGVILVEKLNGTEEA